NWHEDPVSLLLAHFFNHQTHHRGQVHDMLCQTEVAPPVLDMHRVLRPEPVR
ncbi:MAG: damage-inducible protein DinB, partial [SAR324 cluster bacterium]|nr:damage-inducible protein DinB [SAR324 cluster bacterium]